MDILILNSFFPASLHRAAGTKRIQSSRQQLPLAIWNINDTNFMKSERGSLRCKVKQGNKGGQ